MRIRRPFITIIFVLLIIIAGFVLLLRGCLSRYDERSAFSSVLYFEKDNTAVVFSLVKFEKAVSYSRQGGFVRKSVSTSYYIQVNDAGSAKKIKARKIKHHSDIKNYPVEVLGASAENAWIFIGEPMAFNAFTLERTADIETLETRNPQLKGKFPSERRYYEFNRGNNSISFTAIDGSGWILNTKTLLAETTDGRSATAKSNLEEIEDQLKINRQKQDSIYQQKNYRPARMLSGKEISRKEYDQVTNEYYEERKQLAAERDSLQALRSKMMRMKSEKEETERRIRSLSEKTTVGYYEMKINQDTVTGKWYGLYSQKELGKLSDRVYYNSVNDETARRQLFVSEFSIDQNGQVLINKDKAAAMTAPQFLDGGFLVNRQTAKPIQLNNPASFLVVYKNQVGNEARLQLSRVRFDGKIVWTFDSPLKEWGGYFFEDSQFILTGTNNKELSSGEYNVLICLDLVTGRVSSYDFFKDK